MIISILLSSCSLDFDAEDGWQEQWDKIVIQETKKVSLVKIRMASRMSDIFSSIVPPPEREASAELAPAIIDLLQSAGSEFEQFTRQEENLKMRYIMVKLVSDATEYDPLRLVDPSSDYPDRSFSSYKYGIRVYVIEDGRLFVQDRDFILYKAGGTVDYAALHAVFD